MRSFSTPALATLTLALALTACGGGSVDADADGDGTITGAEVREAAARIGDDLKPEPGQYSTTVEFLKLDAPGAPPQLAQAMRGMMNRSDEFCLTPEMAEKGFAESIKEGQNEACTISTFAIDDGDVRMQMDCADQEGMGAMTISMNGTVTPTNSDMTMEMDGNAPGLGRVQMAMSFKQQRIGECQ